MTITHGTYRGYTKGRCRCEACSAANIAANKRYRLITGAGRDGVPARPQTIDATPIRAHLETLYASGWTARELATETGITPNRVGEVRRGYLSTRVTHATAARILAVEPLPDLTDYADPVVVDRLLAGVIPWDAATRPERVEAARRGYGRGGWWDWAKDVLRLNSVTLTAIAAERRAA